MVQQKAFTVTLINILKKSGIIGDIIMQRIGLDSMVFIYFFEKREPYAPHAREIISKIEKGEILGFTSFITDIEALSIPKLQSDLVLYDDMVSFFQTTPHLKVKGVDWEISLATAKVRQKYPKLKLVFHSKNKGYGAAIRSGIAASAKDLLFYTDGDGQYDVFELRRLLPIMQEGVDIVNGYKILRQDPFHRVLIGIVYLRLMRLLFNFKLRDIDCDFRLVRRNVFDRFQLKHDSGVICLEMIKKMELAGCRFAEYPVHHFHRSYGKSQFFQFNRLARTLWNIARLWWQIMILRERPVGTLHVEDNQDRRNPTMVEKQ